MQITRTTPLRRITLQRSHIRLTDALTFISRPRKQFFPPTYRTAKGKLSPSRPPPAPAANRRERTRSNHDHSTIRHEKRDCLPDLPVSRPEKSNLFSRRPFYEATATRRRIASAPPARRPRRPKILFPVPAQFRSPTARQSPRGNRISNHWKIPRPQLPIIGSFRTLLSEIKNSAFQNSNRRPIIKTKYSEFHKLTSASTSKSPHRRRTPRRCARRARTGGGRASAPSSRLPKHPRPN